MGKKEYCTYCIEFHQRTSRHWGCSNRVVEVPGCEKCYSRHEAEVSTLKAKLTSWEELVEDIRESHETGLAELHAKFTHELLQQNSNHEQLLSELKLKTGLELTELKADNESLRKKIQFLQVRRDSLRSDIVLLAAPDLGGVTAHRTILAAKSPLFQRMIQSEIETKSGKAIKIDAMSGPVLEAMVDFCYSGEITFSELVHPNEVLKAAHAFELGLLRELCDVELCRNLSVDNVPQMLKLSRKFEAPRLQEEAGRLFQEHFDAMKGRVYEVLEGPDTTSIAGPISGACPEEDDQWGLDATSIAGLISKACPEEDDQCSRLLIDPQSQVV